MTNECVIYDFETLSQDTHNGVVISFALLSFSEDRYTSNPYKYDELVSNCKYIKFDVEEQVRTFKRTIDPNTLDWWASMGPEAKKQIAPSPDDVSIRTLHKFLLDNIDLKNHKKAYTRGNTFDPVFLDGVLKHCNNTNPMHWRTVRDTRSMIDGMSYGMNIRNDFTPTELVSKFVKHNPCHDIAMDVMRMQLLAQAIGVQ